MKRSGRSQFQGEVARNVRITTHPPFTVQVWNFLILTLPVLFGGMRAASPAIRLRVRMASTATGPPGGPCGNKVKPPSPPHRFVIVLHSPDRVPESGLRVCRPEKKATNARRVSPADSFLQPVWWRQLGSCGDFALFFPGLSSVFSTSQTVWRMSGSGAYDL
jgi:hypothetical protein